MRPPPQHSSAVFEKCRAKGIPQFQNMQRREGECHSTIDQVSLSLRGICVCDVVRNQKAAVSVMARLQKGFSSRSSRTKFGNTRSPKIRFARASTSGHATRLVCFDGAGGDSSSKARIAKKTFSRSRAGNALTCVIRSVTLIPLPTRFDLEHKPMAAAAPPGQCNT
jgi:hypothetical protein